MKIDDILKQELKNKDFAEAYNAEKERSASALALHYARREAGLTQSDLAQRAGVSRSTIVRIENGDNVSFDKLSEIAHAMGKHLRIEIV